MSEAGGGNIPASEGNTTPPAGTSAAAGAGKGSGSGRGSGGRGGGRGHNRFNQGPAQVVSSTQKDFTGMTPDVGGILALANEKGIIKRTDMDSFLKLMGDYTVAKIKNGGLIYGILTTGNDPLPALEAAIQDPSTIANSASDMVKRVFLEDRKRAQDKVENAKTALQALYGAIKGQCTPALLGMVERETEFVTKNTDFDVLWLIGKLRLAIAGVDTKANKLMVVYNALTRLVNMRQGKTEANDNFRRRFKDNVKKLIAADGGNCILPKGAGTFADQDNPTNDELDDLCEKFQAIIFLMRADENRFLDLQSELERDQHKGVDHYPESVDETYDLLCRRSDDLMSRRTRLPGSNIDTRSGLSYAQDRSNVVPGRDGNVVERECYNCGARGHMSPQCPEEPNQNRGRDRGGGGRGRFHYHGLSFSQHDESIPSSWILLDTCSTCSVSNNNNHVSNISSCPSWNFLQVVTNGGGMLFNEWMTLVPVFSIVAL